jgi:hypothetical protein
MKAVLALLLIFSSGPALAGITRVEYRQSLRDYPDEDGRFDYQIHLSGREKFSVFLERWEWKFAGSGTSVLTFKDRLLILDDLPLEISHGPEDLLHEHVSLRRLEGSSPEGSVSLNLGDGRYGSETLAIKSPKLASYFPAAGPVTFRLNLGATKRVYGTFAPALSDAEEKKVCWEGEEYRSDGCELFTVLTVWGNEVDHLSNSQGERAFGDFERGADNRGRLKRQGFLRVSLPGHLKGKLVQLRDAFGRILLEGTI